MEDPLHRDLERAAASTSKTLQSSLCDVCQGLFDKESPRGFLLEGAPHDLVYGSTRYTYTFIHHANLEALLASAEAGCRLCAMIGTNMEPGSTVSATECSPAQRPGRPIAGAKTAQPNEDLLAAMKLVDYGKRERAVGISELDQSRSGRIIIQSYLDNDSQGRFYDDAAAKIFRLSESYVIPPRPSLYHFCTPCMFEYHQKTNCIRRLMT